MNIITTPFAGFDCHIIHHLEVCLPQAPPPVVNVALISGLRSLPLKSNMISVVDIDALCLGPQYLAVV